MKTSDMKTEKHSSGKKWLIMVIGILLALALAAGAAWWFLVVQNVARELTVEAGTQSVEAREYLLRDWDIPAAFSGDMSAVDLNRPGDYPVRISYYGRVYDAVLLVRDTVCPEAELRELTVLSVQTLEPEDFISEIRDVTQVTASFETEPDLTVEGVQTVTLLLTDESGNVTRQQTTVTVVFDNQGPVIEGVQSHTIYRGHTPDYLTGVTITDDQDEMPALTVDDSNVLYDRGGEFLVTYIGTDQSGNETRVQSTLTIIVDDDAPSILGIQPISLYVGSTVSYRSGILVTDEIDPNPVLKLDSSAVDVSQPGSYEVIYIATDEAGNERRVATPVTVKEKTAHYVEEATIIAMADQILNTIIKDGMTDREKVEAVYNWILGHCSYYGASDKTDWMQAAYSLMLRRIGDCFNFYALSKLMLDRLEIPNITVTRCANPYRMTGHYWSLVSVDGGETYYHFDTTPRSGNYNFCLVTDAYLDAFERNYHPGYYARNLDLYPATPLE